MATADEEITKLFKVRRTVLQMLRDRGYTVEDSDITMTRQNFVDKFGENMKRDDLVIHTCKGENLSDQIYVFFPEGQKGIGVPIVKGLATRLKAENVLNAIVVVPKGLTAPAKKAVEEINKFCRMETFEDGELLVNVTEHVLVPHHKVLTNDEKKEILGKYGVKDLQLPRILISDPIARYYGLKRGQIVKITRQSQTADEYETYRLAV